MAQDPQDQVLAQGDLFIPEGQRAKSKRQRQEIEDEGKEEGNKKEGREYLSSGVDKRLPLDREETDMTYRNSSL